MNIYRGNIFYVREEGSYCGTEQQGSRPALVVSNNTGNEHSGQVTIVYLTTKDKKPLPTHVKIMCKVPSTALCEQITTVSKERLGDYIRCATPAEMRAIDKALAITLGLDNTVVQAQLADEQLASIWDITSEPAANNERTEISYVCEIESLKGINRELQNRMAEEKEKAMEVIAEKNTYKKLFNELLDRLTNR